MKKCPKCGFENSADSLFCEHCGTKLPDDPVQETAPAQPETAGQLNDDQQPSGAGQSAPKKHNSRHVAVAVIVAVIVVAVIGYFLGSRSANNSDSSSHAANSSVASSSSSSQDDEMVVSQMDDKTKAAAAYYYGSQHVKKFGNFQLAAKQGGLSIMNDMSSNSAKYDKGDDPVGLMPLNTGAGSVNFFTTDGDKVYFYIPSAIPGATGDEEATEENRAQPVLEATWQQIAKYVNSQGAYNQVKRVADGSDITGN